MELDQDDFSNWKPNISIADMLKFSEFKEKIFYLDLILTENSGQKILDAAIGFPNSPEEWIKTNRPVMLSDGYSVITFDSFTYALFLRKDSSQVCSWNFNTKAYLIKNSIREDLKKAKQNG